MKGMTASARLDMSTVEEEKDDANDTMQIIEESPHMKSIKGVSNPMTMSVNFTTKATESRGNSEVVSDRSSDLSSENEGSGREDVFFTPM
jgi:hypothetical protein